MLSAAICSIMSNIIKLQITFLFKFIFTFLTSHPVMAMPNLQQPLRNKNNIYLKQTYFVTLSLLSKISVTKLLNGSIYTF